MLEEDIALANTALDLLGQARLWLTLYGEREGRGRGEDDLAYFRQPAEFRNLLLVEQPNGHFGDTMARQFLFDAWHQPVLAWVAASADPQAAAIAAKAEREAAYHLRRSAAWVVRLGDGTAESHARIQASFDDLWTFTGDLFDCLEFLRPAWRRHLEPVFAAATLTLPADGYMHGGSRQGLHTETLGYVLAEMQSLARAYPGAKW